MSFVGACMQCETDAYLIVQISETGRTTAMCLRSFQSEKRCLPRIGAEGPYKEAFKQPIKKLKNQELILRAQ